MIRQALEAEGSRVLLALDGAQGLAVIADNEPDLVRCDLSMPRMDGFAFIKQLRAAGRTLLPVIALTGIGREHVPTGEAASTGMSPSQSSGSRW